MLRLIPAVLFLATGCNNTCGTVGLATQYVDIRYDTNQDGTLDLVEHCGVLEGVYGRHYPAWDLAQLTFSTSESDIADSVQITYDYLPIATVQVRWSDLMEPGKVIEGDSISGIGGHIYSGNSLDFPTFYPLTSGRIEVVSEAKPYGQNSTVYQYDDRHRARIKWALTFGDPAAEHYEGEDVVQILLDQNVYTDLSDFTSLPADYEAP